MIGISVYLNNINYDYLNEVKNIGVNNIFSSFKMIEENYEILYPRALELIKYCNEHNINLIVDVDEKSAQRFNLKTIFDFKELGINHIRVDGGISNKEIAKLSNQCTVYLNASDISKNQLEELIKYDVNVQNCYAMHNFYPLQYTGLEQNYFKEINSLINSYGIEVIAFIPGDRKLRGPVYNGLPTLEHHRGERPFVCYLQMQELGVDNVFIGDNEASLKELALIVKEDIIELEVDMITNIDYNNVLNTKHTIRPDYNSHVIRISNRSILKEKDSNNVFKLVKGAITIENENAIERYIGEVQIIKKSLDISINSKTVIGYIKLADLPLLNLIKPHHKIRLKEKDD